MVALHFLIGFLFCLGSFAQEHLILEHYQFSDVVEELKLLRKEVGENRKRIVNQESELEAVKLELEETKRHCHCEPKFTEDKSGSEKNEVLSNDQIPVIRKGGQSRKERIIPRINPPAGHNEPIVFYAHMSAPMNNIGGHHTLIFDVIKSNSGFGLHPTTGIFSAPTSGFYVFTWTIRVRNGHHGVELVVNGQAIGCLYQYSNADDDDMSSTTAVFHVNEGEDVFLRTKISYNEGVIYNTDYGSSSFAGWKLT